MAQQNSQILSREENSMSTEVLDPQGSPNILNSSSPTDHLQSRDNGPQSDFLHGELNSDSNSTSAVTSVSQTLNDELDCPQPHHVNRHDVVCTDNINCENNKFVIKTDEPPSKLRKLNTSDDDVDGETCPICLDAWGSSGKHRLVALKCGHLFGSSCVERWLKAQNIKERSCPTCKSKAAIKDLRHIYARRLIAADTSEITNMQRKIDILQQDKNRIELELQKSKVAHLACLAEMDKMTRLLATAQTKKQHSWKFALEKNLEMTKDGGCRVQTYNSRTYELYVSQKCFPGYGIRKVNFVDYKIGPFMYLHSSPIRDIKYSLTKDLLLSVGLDKTAKIVERGVPITTIQTGVPLWSCSWNYLSNNEFYVGGVRGCVMKYDIRNASSPLQSLTVPGDLSPTISLCSSEFGLLTCHLNSCWLWEPNEQGNLAPRHLPVEGPFMSLCYDNFSSRVVVTCRPSANDTKRSKITLCKLTATLGGEVMCSVERTFTGSASTSVMCRSALVNTSENSWVAAHSESDSLLYLHGIDNTPTLTLPASEPARDICSVSLNGDTFLTALSATRLRIYKAVCT